MCGGGLLHEEQSVKIRFGRQASEAQTLRPALRNGSAGEAKSIVFQPCLRATISKENLSSSFTLRAPPATEIGLIP